jgi:hypothetical protein
MDAAPGDLAEMTVHFWFYLYLFSIYITLSEWTPTWQNAPPLNWKQRMVFVTHRRIVRRKMGLGVQQSCYIFKLTKVSNHVLWECCISVSCFSTFIGNLFKHHPLLYHNQMDLRIRSEYLQPSFLMPNSIWPQLSASLTSPLKRQTRKIIDRDVFIRHKSSCLFSMIGPTNSWKNATLNIFTNWG